MRRRRLGMGAGVTILALSLLGATAAIVHGATRPLARGSGGAGLAPGGASARTLTLDCSSPSLGGRLPALAYLPAGYSPRGAPLPVVYFLHGLPAGPRAYTGNGFVARALVRAHERAIVVAPQGARRPDSDREYLDWSATEDWPRAIADDLTTCVDHRLHTIASRSGRVLVGLSAGGYGALNIGLRNLATFGAVESWSGYFVATDPSGEHALKLGSPAAQAAAAVPHGAPLANALASEPSLLGFYVGRADDRFVDANEAFDRSLVVGRIPHVFRTYRGGHSAALWRAQAPGWLRMALVYLASGRTVAP